MGFQFSCNFSDNQEIQYLQTLMLASFPWKKNLDSDLESGIQNLDCKWIYSENLL